MSVSTEADERLRAAKDNIRDAYNNLLKTIDVDIWGGDSWTLEFREKVERILIDLSRMKRELG